MRVFVKKNVGNARLITSSGMKNGSEEGEGAKKEYFFSVWIPVLKEMTWSTNKGGGKKARTIALLHSQEQTRMNKKGFSPSRKTPVLSH